MANTNHRFLPRLVLASVLASLALPSISSATTPAAGSSSSTATAASTTCDGSEVTFEFHSETDEIYQLDCTTGSLVLVTAEEIEIDFGTNDLVLVNIEYDVPAVDVDIFADGTLVAIHTLTNGSLQYYINAEVGLYEFVASESQQTQIPLKWIPIKLKPRPILPPF